jgi:hypothetical protein
MRKKRMKTVYGVTTILYEKTENKNTRQHCVF